MTNEKDGTHAGPTFDLPMPTLSSCISVRPRPSRTLQNLLKIIITFTVPVSSHRVRKSQTCLWRSLLAVTRIPADAEVARHASRLKPPKCKTPHFPHALYTAEFKITRYYDQGTQIAKTPIYPVMCQFPLFVACDHNPPTLPAES